MNEEETGSESTKKSKPQPYRVSLPGFITDEDVGLGDIIKRATSAVGIPPCGGCAHRAAQLNNWFVFSGRRSSRRRI
jgi:hypothetical protein